MHDALSGKLKPTSVCVCVRANRALGSCVMFSCYGHLILADEFYFPVVNLKNQILADTATLVEVT